MKLSSERLSVEDYDAAVELFYEDAAVELFYERPGATDLTEAERA